MDSTERLDQRIRFLVAELVDGAPPAPAVPTEQAVRRRRRHRRFSLAAVPLSVVLLAGAASATVPALMQTSPGVTRLFVRSTGTGVQVRTYEVTTNAVMPYVEAEVSTDGAIGLLDANIRGTVAPGRLVVPAATDFGTGRGKAIAVAVRAGSGIAMVRADFASGATDAMRPVDGWAVLAGLGGMPGGRVVGFNASGRPLASVAMVKPVASGEGFPGESEPTFVRVTDQGVLVIGHTVQPTPGGARWLYPYLADGAAVQLGLEGVASCRPPRPTALDAGVVIVGAEEGETMTVVIVHAGNAIRRVRVEFSGGAHDEMSTVAGQAVLVTLGTVERSAGMETLQSGTVAGFDADGRVAAETPVYRNSTPYAGCTS